MLHLRDLHCFMQVYEARSFSKAADSLDTVQSLVSTRIQRREEFIDAQLFVRLHRGVVSTDRGELLYWHAKRVLRDVKTGQIQRHHIERPQLPVEPLPHRQV